MYRFDANTRKYLGYVVLGRGMVLADPSTFTESAPPDIPAGQEAILGADGVTWTLQASTESITAPLPDDVAAASIDGTDSVGS